jgi:general secretion pathway protein E
MTSTATNETINVQSGGVPEIPQPLRGLLRRAAKERATDLHIDAAVVRFRTDGIVQTKERLTAGQANTIINQIRVAGRMDVGAVHRPVEGHFRFPVDGRMQSVRAEIVPVGADQRAAHLRLLAGADEWRDLAHLGLAEVDREIIERVLARQHGLILIAGPTGSGKTTTLYALASCCDPQRNVVATIEDPVEFDLPFARQIQVAEEQGLTMEQGLRALLRMDPDVIVVGEIGDRESAQIAGQAALGGRLVLATVHGRSPATAVEAMHHLGVPFYSLGASLRLVLAQRLIRRVCPACSELREPDDEERQLFDRAGLAIPSAVPEAVGCDACHGYGFRGRTGVFELVPVDDALGNWLTRGQAPAALGQRFDEAAVCTFAHSALQKVADGITSISEVRPLFGGKLDRPTANGDPTND